MKFDYQYRTSDNVEHSGRISAADRESAFKALRARGIRPSRVCDAPGVANKILGKGKRWFAIVVLAVIVALGLAYGIVMRSEERFAAEDRAQIFADPVELQGYVSDGWVNCMGSESDAWFARHARPGVLCGCVSNDVSLSARPVPIRRSDADAVKKMKRMVNQMKREFAAYVDAGGSESDYCDLCCQRVRVEKNIADNAAHDFARMAARVTEENRASVEMDWKRKNEALRSMGLRTVVFPE